MGTLIMKIAGITWHGVDNYGSMLQAYALQKTIEKIGVKHTYISYTKKANVKYVLYYYYRYLRSMIPWLTERKDLFSRFHRKNIKATFRLFTQIQFIQRMRSMMALFVEVIKYGHLMSWIRLICWIL